MILLIYNKCEEFLKGALSIFYLVIVAEQLALLEAT